MKKLVAFAFTLFVGLSFSTGVLAKEAKKPSVKKERVVNVNATVEAIDLNTRVVKLKEPNGNTFTVKVGEEAKNLPQVKVGDLVTAKYYESLFVEVRKPGAPGGVTASSAVATAKPGDMPAGVVTDQVTVSTTVQAIDKKKNYVTLQGPEGNSVKVKVQDPKNLKNVKVGDQVEITYTEAFAISVEKAVKK